MAKSEKSATVLVGKFEDAQVIIGDWFPKTQNPDDFKQPSHDVTFKGQTYRFINSDQLSEESIKELEQEDFSIVFGGDLTDVRLEITSGGIRSQYLTDPAPEV